MVRKHFSKMKIFKMNNERQIRCQKINERQKSDLCVKISIRNQIMKNNFVSMKKEFHIMIELSCLLIMKIDFMKFFDVAPK